MSIQEFASVEGLNKLKKDRNQLVFIWQKRRKSEALLTMGFQAMNRINRKVEYALMALKVMSQKYSGQLTTAKEICATTGIPFDATSRVMQQMAQKGVLKSEQGSHGGYLIARDLSKVSFREVAEIILGPVEVVRCANSTSDCEFLSKCNVQSPLQNLNARLVQFYQTVTVAELLNLNHQNEKEKSWETPIQRST